MANVAKVKAYKKREKKHGKKTFVRPSQKKAVKNGRHQEKQVPDKKNVKKAVAAIPAGLDGDILDDEDELSVEDEYRDEDEGTESETELDEDEPGYPDKEY